MKNENYPLYEVDPISNLKELVNHTAEKYGDKPAFIFERQKETVSVSYRQFKSDVDALGTALFDMGMQNSKVALIGENSYEWILTYFAVVNSGNVIVPLDKELPAADIKSLTDHSGAEMLVFSDAFSDVAAYLKENGVTIQYYVNMNEIPKLIEQGEDAIKCGNNSVVTCEIDNNALTALMYTSGTTGNAKGVMLSHKNLSCNAVGTCKIVSFPESYLLILPLQHIFALDVGLSVMMLHGSMIAINSSLKNIPGDMKKYKPRNIFMVPLLAETFYKQILTLAGHDTSQDNLMQLSNAVFGGNQKTIVCGGAPLDVKYAIGYRELGVEFIEGYGLTECSGVVSANRNQYYRDDSIGQTLPNCEVKIAEPDENGHGEICVKGDIVMLGYYKNEQATKEAFDGEWFKTGDLGYLDQDGFLFISGRKKNLIVLSNGKNVYPEELEFALLTQIPYVKETVVYARDNEIIAEVFLDVENNPDCAARLNNDIVEFNKTQAPYKNINRTVIRDTEFPKTTTKKIKRQYTKGVDANA